MAITAGSPSPYVRSVIQVLENLCGCHRMVVGFQLPMPPVPITTNVSNPAQARCIRYKIM
jgi:hypothetical protein